METASANRLAALLGEEKVTLCDQVAVRLLQTYPELISTLRLEESYAARTRLAQVAVERLEELIRAMLVFDLPVLAENEFRWARGVLPRWGVTDEHQSMMVRFFFEEVHKLGLDAAEVAIARDTEHYLLALIREIYHATDYSAN